MQNRRVAGAAAAKERPPPAGGNSLVTFDAQLAKQQVKNELDKHRGSSQHVAEYTGPKVKWEDTGLYKAMVRTQDIEEELVKIRNLIRKRTDPGYEPDDDDFKVEPARKFNAKADYYRLLDLEDFATAKDIKGAYKKFALQFHPDKNRDKKPDQLSEMQDEFQKIQEAYEVLSDRATRRQYDRAKFDEARAKSQGMQSSMYSQKTNTNSNFWGRWSARKAQEGQGEKGSATGATIPSMGKAPKLPKAPDLVVEIKISLEKALRGGLKIREVKRDRMQRAFGAASKAAKSVHAKIEPGQADGSEYRLDGDGNWPSLSYTPGDLVFQFKHKPHTYLRQVGCPGDGNLQLASPLTVRARATEQVIAVWSPTFKGQMLLLRFANPLSTFSPSKSCSLAFRVDGEGLPILGDSLRRGSLTVTVSVHLEGEALVPFWGDARCKAVLLRRHVRDFNHLHHVRADLAPLAAAGTSSIRVYACGTARERDGDRLALPALLTVWQAPVDIDPVVFTKAASALGFHARRDPGRFVWCYHRRLAPLCLAALGHSTLADNEIASDDEESGPPGGEHRPAVSSASAAAAPSGGGAFDFEALDTNLPSTGSVAPPRKQRGQRQRSEKEQFLLMFDLGPPDGLPDPASTDEEPGGSSPSRVAHRASAGLPEASAREKLTAVGVQLQDAEKESKEEQDLTQLIRQRQSEMEQARRKWSNRKQRLKGERADEEGTLRELLEKDKRREYERIEKEMEGLRSTFEYQVTAEKKWMDEFKRDSKHRNEWICVFKPAMVARGKPVEDGPALKRIMLDEVVKAKGEPTEDNWIQLEGQPATTWALTWHQKHGRLLQQWHGMEQNKFKELQSRVEERRNTRNQTFVDYRRKKNEIEQWSIPPGPTQEELYEIEDEEGEQLSAIVEPMLKEIREHKRRLRELRQRRLEQSAELARRVASGGSALGDGALPRGFRVQEDGAATVQPLEEESLTSAEHAAPPANAAAAVGSGLVAEWQRTKQAAERAFKEKDWNTALRLYGQSLDEGGGDLGSMHAATLLSNRALVRSKLDDWRGSLEDAVAATGHETEWPKGWLRRATAELRLNRNREALASLKRGLSCAGKLSGQFLPLVTECEAALYGDKDDEAPDTAAARIQTFKTDGSTCFEQGNFGTAVLFYTRALYHRSMMEGTNEAIVLSNRSGAFLKLALPSEALADALSSSERDPRWAKPLVRAGQAALLLDDFKSAYQHFAKARVLDEHYKTAADGVNECLQRIIKWEYPAAAKRWTRFSVDRQRLRESTRIWALSDVFFDQHGVPEWCKSLSSSFFRDDVLVLAGNLADSLPQLRFALTVLKSKFRRIFYVPGNHDLWVRRVTLQTILKGENVKDEQRSLIDSVSKLLEVLQVCDEMGIETAPAEVAAGVFVVPMYSWYSRDFVPRERRREMASQTDAEAKVTIDPWIKWPFPCGSDDAWKFFMRMNETALRATLASKSAFERFTDKKAVVITMTHFLTRPDLDIDWTVPGIWDYVGCDGLDEQIRAIGSNVHVYGRACIGPTKRELDGLTYVHNYIGSTEKHRPGMAPFCIFDRGQLVPQQQPTQDKGFNFKPLERPVEEVPGRRFGGG